ncbi:MAG: hypothetical protein Q8920_02455 [Bacillota bacterium]|nr:hypothetical protein [Bacillota bacterium]
MYKVKIGLLNLICMGLVGALMQFVWVLLSGKTDQLTLYDVVNMMCMCAIVGTICLFALFYVTLRCMGSLLRAIVTNAVLGVVLCFLIYLETGVFFGYWALDTKWIVILVIAVAASSVMTNIWYKRIKFYNGKLEMKKASLKEKRH